MELDPTKPKIKEKKLKNTSYSNSPFSGFPSPF